MFSFSHGTNRTWIFFWTISRKLVISQNRNHSRYLYYIVFNNLPGVELSMKNAKFKTVTNSNTPEICYTLFSSIQISFFEFNQYVMNIDDSARYHQRTYVFTQNIVLRLFIELWIGMDALVDLGIVVNY